MWTVSSTTLFGVNISAPESPKNFSKISTFFANQSVWKPEELVISRDESFLMILGQSSMVSVYTLNSTSTSTALLGWLDSYGIEKEDAK